MTDDELAAQLEAMRGDPEAWGPPAQEGSAKRRSERRRRHAMVSVRFTPDELEAVQARAASAGIAVSGYLRGLALSAPQPVASCGWKAVAANQPATKERVLVRTSLSGFPGFASASLAQGV